MTGHTVLLADDDVQVANVVSKLLESAGHTVVGKAANGNDAVWLNQTLCPDVAIVDLQMPVTDGLQASKKMMETRPVPIVICTAFYDDKLINKASNNGVYAYVVKPCRLADILPAINVAISRFEETRLLKSELDSMREALEARKWIEQAKGIVMRTRQLQEADAHRFLQQQSQRQSKPLHEIAKAIVVAEDALSPKLYGSGSVKRCRM